MTIVLVSGSFPDVRCGIGDYTSRLALGLARRAGTRVVVVTSDDERIRSDAAPPAEVVRGPGWGLPKLRALLQTIRRNAPDIVHVQYPAVGYGRGLGIVLLPLALRLFTRTPTVLTIHERRERRMTARAAIDVMALSSRLVITLDPVEASSLKQTLRRFAPPMLTGAMISTIPVAAGIDREAWRARFGAAAGDMVAISFGLIHPRRRIDRIIDAVAKLRDSGVRVRLWVVGGEAEYDLETARAYVVSLKEQARTAGIEDVTEWMSHADPETVSACMQAADVCVLLYPGGASGRNTTLQAAREHGLPVVTTVGQATSESLRREKRILFLSDGEYTTADLADAMLKARDMGVAAPLSPIDAHGLGEHVDFHLSAYASLSPSQAAGLDASGLRPRN